MNQLNFIDIFNGEIETEKKGKIKLSQIIIPKIQRDYAQGRMDFDTKRIRERFLDALYEATTNQPITLDFIYGDIDEKGVMVPLDGQQRLSTLFLLHWFAAKKEKISKEEYNFLHKFGYETRYSARDFCQSLIDFEPNFEGNQLISTQIENEDWFPLNWKKDQTIGSMLVMLDAIYEKFTKVDNLWGKLKNNAVTFHFLAISDMGLTDELYIKMNSRGKPLTKFENFKAELENELKKINQELAKCIIQKIDRTWTDLLWIYRDENHLIDNRFLNYFRFICDIICYKNRKTSFRKEKDELDLIRELFLSTNPNVVNHVKMLENFFDCWVKIQNEIGIRNFFGAHVCQKHEVNKIKIDSSLDIFEDCIKHFNSYFPLSRVIILYAFITYLLNQDKITEEQFRRRIRVVNNLVNNSQDEISDSEKRIGGNRIPAMLEQVDSIIITGQIKKELGINFNKNQLLEEEEKLEWTNQNPEKMESLFELEDHEYLFGQIAVIGLENADLFSRFITLFQCNLDKIDCALITIGNYAQQANNKNWRYQLGSKGESEAWKNLFHQGSNNYFNRTKEILVTLLKKEGKIDAKFLDVISQEYLTACEQNNLYDWRYYYIKYSEFRPGAYGKYCWKDYENKPYEILVMLTRTNLSDYAYQPFLKVIDKNNRISTDDFSNNRIIENYYNITVTNNSYILSDKSTRNQLKEIKICQNENGIDAEDRIKKMKEFLKQKESRN